MGDHWETSPPSYAYFTFWSHKVDMNVWIFLDIHCIELVGSEGHEKGMTLIDTREMLHCTMLSGPYPDYPDYPPPAMLSQCYQANNKQWHSAHTSSAQPSPPPPPTWAGTWTWNLITWTLSIQCASAVQLELVCVADMATMFVQNICFVSKNTFFLSQPSPSWRKDSLCTFDLQCQTSLKCLVCMGGTKLR